MPKNNNRKNARNQGARRNGSGKVTVPRFFKPGPTVQYADFAYAIQPGLTEPALGAGMTYAISLNSIYDPDVTGAGSTASGYSTYSNFFTRYRVISVRVQVNAAPYSTSGGTMILGVMMGPNTTVSATPRVWPVQTNSHSRVVHAANPAVMFCYDKVISLPAILGVTKKQYETDFDYSGPFGSNPTRQAYLILWVLGTGSAAAVSSWDVRVTYHTELSQPLQSVSS
jgi:hypothetical protein